VCEGGITPKCKLDENGKPFCFDDSDGVPLADPNCPSLQKPPPKQQKACPIPPPADGSPCPSNCNCYEYKCIYENGKPSCYDDSDGTPRGPAECS